LQEEVSALRGTLSEAEAEVGSLQTHVSDIQADKQCVEEALASRDRDIESMRSELVGVKEELSRENAEHEERLTQLEDELLKAKNDFCETKQVSSEQLAALQVEFDEVSSHAAALERQLAEDQTHVTREADNESVVANLTEENSLLNENALKLSEELTTVKEALAKLKDEKENDEFDIENLELQLEKMRKKNSKLNQELEEAHTETERSQEELKNATHESHDALPPKEGILTCNEEDNVMVSPKSSADEMSSCPSTPIGDGGGGDVHDVLAHAQAKIAQQAKKIDNLKSSRLRVQEEVDRQTTALQFEVQRLTEEHSTAMKDLSAKNKHIIDLQQAYQTLLESAPHSDSAVAQSNEVSRIQETEEVQEHSSSEELEKAMQEVAALQEKLNMEKSAKFDLQLKYDQLIDENAQTNKNDGVDMTEVASSSSRNDEQNDELSALHAKIAQQAKKIDNLKSSRLRVQEEVDRQTTALQFEVQRLTEEHSTAMKDLSAKNKHIIDLQQAYQALQEASNGSMSQKSGSSTQMTENEDSSKLAEFRQLSDELRHSLSLKENELNNAVTELATLQQQYESSDMANEQARRDHMAHCADLENRLSATLEERDRALEEAAEVPALIEDNERLEKELFDKNTELHDAQVALHAKENEEKDDSENNDAGVTVSGADDHDAVVSELRSSLEEAQQVLAYQEKKLQKSKQCTTGLEEEVEMLRFQNQQAAEKNTALEAELTEKTDTIQQMTEEMDEVLRQLEVSEGTNTALTEMKQSGEEGFMQQLDELRKQLATSKDEVHHLQQTNSSNELRPSSDSNQLQDQEIQRLRDELSAQDARIQELSQSSHTTTGSDDNNNDNSRELQIELDDANELIVFQTKKIENLKMTRDQLQEQLDKLGSALYNLDGNSNGTTPTSLESNGVGEALDVKELKDTILRLEEELAAVSEESEVTRVEADMMIKQIDEIEAEKIILQQEILQYTSSESAASSRTSVMTLTVQRSDSDMDEDNSQHLADHSHEIEKLKKSLNKMKKKCEQYEIEAEEQEANMTQLINEKQEIESKLNQLNEGSLRNGKAEEDIPDSEEMITELERRIEILLEDRRKLNKSRIEEMENAQELLDEARAELEDEKRVFASRLEELENERNGYKDAMVKAYEDANDMIQKANAEKSNAGGGGGIMSGFLGSNKQTLQELAALKKQMVELKPLEKLRPQILSLQQELAAAEKDKKEMKEKLTEDNVLLTEHNEELMADMERAKLAKETLAKEVEVSKGLVLDLTERVKALEGEGRQLQVDLKEARLEVEYVRSISADPSVVGELEGKVKELLSEKKHWQKKAQSLSKDVQRLMGTGDEAMELREENHNLKYRIEELKAERQAFRDVMQQTMMQEVIAPEAKSSSKGGVFRK